MHDFLDRKKASETFQLPREVYAYLVDGEDNEGGDGQNRVSPLLDAVNARDFRTALPVDAKPGWWRGQVGKARIYAIEIDREISPDTADWLRRAAKDMRERWVKIELVADPNGEAAVYGNIAGEPLRARLSINAVSSAISKSLANATDLGPLELAQNAIESAIPTTAIEAIYVLDVGQGSAAALVGPGGDVVAYVDVGAGTLKNAATLPKTMTTACIHPPPVVVLSHWHYDHFHFANLDTRLLTLGWIAPLQTLGPGPQSAMASALGKKLMVWSGTTPGHHTLQRGQIELERCTNSSSTSQNRTGIAVWVHGPNNEAPISLPGDAGYGDMKSSPRTVSGLVVSHHGGTAAGTPFAKPLIAGRMPRLAFSYGYKNTYTHPLSRSLGNLSSAPTPGWLLGAGGDDRHTAINNPQTKVAPDHIVMDWSANTVLTRSCSCGCTLQPTQ